MRPERKSELEPGLLLGHVKEGRSIQIFDDEDMAAEFISILKMYEPQDNFIYVIYPHPTMAQRYIVAIFSPPGQTRELVKQTPAPSPKPTSATQKILHRKVA